MHARSNHTFLCYKYHGCKFQYIIHIFHICDSKQLERFQGVDPPEAIILSRLVQNDGCDQHSMFLQVLKLELHFSFNKINILLNISHNSLTPASINIDVNKKIRWNLSKLKSHNPKSIACNNYAQSQTEQVISHKQPERPTGYVHLAYTAYLKLNQTCLSSINDNNPSRITWVFL